MSAVLDRRKVDERRAALRLVEIAGHRLVHADDQLARAIRHARVRGVTRAEIARRLDLSVRAVEQYERRESR